MWSYPLSLIEDSTRWRLGHDRMFPFAQVRGLWPAVPGLDRPGRRVLRHLPSPAVHIAAPIGPTAPPPAAPPGAARTATAGRLRCAGRALPGGAPAAPAAPESCPKAAAPQQEDRRS